MRFRVCNVVQIFYGWNIKIIFQKKIQVCRLVLRSQGNTKRTFQTNTKKISKKGARQENCIPHIPEF